MANTMSTVTRPIKGIVSKKKKRFTEDGFDLDLTYICDKVIAMGFPAENFESFYRNHIDEVSKLLDSRHYNHYKIYNLCSERSYNYSKFHNRVENFPFEDHNPPSIELIQRFCENVDNWLKMDENNVAAIHCKAGKGRTGTMICCYLLHSGRYSTAADALNYYGQQRTHNEKGVTIPSQRRYVEYYARLLNSHVPYQKASLQICEIKLSYLPSLNSHQENLQFSISYLSGLKTEKIQINDCTKVRSDGYIVIKLDQCIALSGDIKLEFYCKKQITGTKALFRFWINTSFVCEDAQVIGDRNDPNSLLIYTLKKGELDDAHKDKQDKLFPHDLEVTLTMQHTPNGTYVRGKESTNLFQSSRTPNHHPGHRNNHIEYNNHNDQHNNTNHNNYCRTPSGNKLHQQQIQLSQQQHLYQHQHQSQQQQQQHQLPHQMTPQPHQLQRNVSSKLDKVDEHPALQASASSDHSTTSARSNDTTQTPSKSPDGSSSESSTGEDWESGESLSVDEYDRDQITEDDIDYGDYNNDVVDDNDDDDDERQLQHHHNNHHHIHQEQPQPHPILDDDLLHTTIILEHDESVERISNRTSMASARTRRSSTSNAQSPGRAGSRARSKSATKQSLQQFKAKSSNIKIQSTKVRWLSNMRSDPDFRDTLAKSVLFRSPKSHTDSLHGSPSHPHHEFDYYSTLCDNQLSVGSPCLSPPGLTAATAAVVGGAAVLTPCPHHSYNGAIRKKSDDECKFLVVAKPMTLAQSSRCLGFKVVEPAQDDAMLNAPANSPILNNNSNLNDITTIMKKPKEAAPILVFSTGSDEQPISISEQSPVVAVDRAALCTIEPSKLTLCDSPVGPRVSRCVPFSFRELRQELQSVMKHSSLKSKFPGNKNNNGKK